MAMDEFVYQTRWRLIYGDGHYLDELPAGSTIRDRRPNPIELHLINLQGMPMLRIEIPKNYKPIFYRQRSISQSPDGTFGEPELDATVLGYGREVGSRMDGQLWMWLSGHAGQRGRAIDCPQQHIDHKAIELQLQVA